MSISAAHGVDYRLPGRAGAEWRPNLFVREQAPASGDRSRPVLYVHGATFPSTLSIFWKIDGYSWADQLNEAGISAWGFDFAGYGWSEPYPAMMDALPPPGEPLGRAPEVAQQLERTVRHILAETGAKRVSIIAHSWGTVAAGLFATQYPELVDRLVFFGPITKRQIQVPDMQLGPWRLLTIEEQHKRFVEDVPKDHPPVLLDRHFKTWGKAYLATAATSGTREPASVRMPNGPIADIFAAWSGTLAYDPAGLRAPLLIVRGEWDSLCTDADAAWLLQAASASLEKQDIRIPATTHLMHLEENRSQLYRAATDFLAGKRADRGAPQMIAVIFEVWPADGQNDAYLDHAATLRPELEKIDGFISVERFQSLAAPEKMLSLSFWRDAEAVANWRNHAGHRNSQRAGRAGIFANYRLRISSVVRDYELNKHRGDAPLDSRQHHQ